SSNFNKQVVLETDRKQRRLRHRDTFSTPDSLERPTRDPRGAWKPYKGAMFSLVLSFAEVETGQGTHCLKVRACAS
ncbi:MAG: hypothetical protein MJE68_14295, partial [Proteobacteria bacterium]|nr:hypothetical protein [Pseudomonadota bacterium]